MFLSNLSIRKSRKLHRDIEEVSDYRQWSWAKRVVPPAQFPIFTDSSESEKKKR